jgi:hypothetical protein
VTAVGSTLLGTPFSSEGSEVTSITLSQLGQRTATGASAATVSSSGVAGSSSSASALGQRTATGASAATSSSASALGHRTATTGSSIGTQATSSTSGGLHGLDVHADRKRRGSSLAHDSTDQVKTYVAGVVLTDSNGDDGNGAMGESTVDDVQPPSSGDGDVNGAVEEEQPATGESPTPGTAPASATEAAV